MIYDISNASNSRDKAGAGGLPRVNATLYFLAIRGGYSCCRVKEPTEGIVTASAEVMELSTRPVC